MLKNQNQKLRRLLVCSFILFIVTFFVYGFAVDKLWFREDDLGTILNGIIRDWHDAVRVFSSDCRSFISPANYQRTSPNVFSGFLRPLQNVVFSAVYWLWGTNPQAYYLVHVGFHAANTALFFLVSNSILPMGLSVLAAGLFAFFPDVSWLTWIGTVQNSLALFFGLLSILLWYGFLRTRRRWILWCAGFAFFLSILARENGVFLPVWFFMGSLFMRRVKMWRERIVIKSKQFKELARKAWHDTWPFFAAVACFASMRLWAFGVATLPRTVHNMLLRYPLLAKACGQEPTVFSAPPIIANVSALSHGVAANSVATQAQAVSVGLHGQGFFSSVLHSVVSLLQKLLQIFVRWTSALGGIDLTTLFEQVLLLFVCGAILIMLINAYRYERSLLVWLALGALCTAWPGVVAYPTPRYLNFVYPFVILMVLYGAYRALYVCSHLRSRLVAMCILFCSVFGVGYRWQINVSALRQAALARFEYRQRFDTLFAQNNFAQQANFVLISSPFVSDIQSIFQSYTNNLGTMVVFDPFATLAERGCMGCRKDYRVKDVASDVSSIPGGFRLVSRDPEHCGWWLRMSDFPLAWLEDKRSYEWTDKSYLVGQWYRCSVGWFKINQAIDADSASDISFVFDKRWITKQTVFVAWDTFKGGYQVVPAQHLQV